MSRPLLTVRLLEWFGTDPAREALIGDLIEEIGLGRSRYWIWRQVMALCGLAALRRVLACAQSTPLIVLAPGLLVLGALWIAPLAKVLATWAVVYFVAGVLSLGGDLIASRTDDWGSFEATRRRAQR